MNSNISSKFFNSWILSSYLNPKLTYHLCYIYHRIKPQTPASWNEPFLVVAPRTLANDKALAVNVFEILTGFMLFSRNNVWNSQKVFLIAWVFDKYTAIFDNSVEFANAIAKTKKRPVLQETFIGIFNLLQKNTLEQNMISWISERLTLQEINISHLGKRKIIDSKSYFWGDMLVPWRVSKANFTHKTCKILQTSVLERPFLGIQSRLGSQQKNLDSWVKLCCNEVIWTM